MKKTAVRVQEYKSDVSQNIGIGIIQILDKQYKESRLEPIGHIQFQRNLADGINGEWYGLSYVVSTSNVSDLKKMNKIADKVIVKCKELNKSSWEIQPVDVLDALNAERHGLYMHEFYPLELAGANLYDINLNGEVYARIATKDEVAAKKEMKKRGFNKHEIKFNSVINF